MNNSQRNILLIQTAFIGDVILATALVEKIASQLPDYQIDFLLRKGNEGLFLGNPKVREVLIWDKKLKYKSLFSLLKTVRNRQYDFVVCLQRFATMGFFTAFSKGKIKIGFDKNPFSFLFSQKIQHQIQSGVHEVERNTKLLVGLCDETVFRPKLFVETTDLTEKFPEALPRKYICLAPTSVWFTKQFPESQWVKLMDTISEEYKIYLMGAGSDSEACDRIMALSTHKSVENLAGKLNFLQSAKLMQGAVLNYVNDSAPMHLCSATNAPVCAIYCSTIPDFGFGPLSDFSRIVEVGTKLDCRPCGLHGHKTCPKGHFKCGFDIEISQLTQVLKEAETQFR
jgi:ADP-heptose:LPS heptosyltransferase